MKRSVNICKWLVVSLFLASIATSLSSAQPSNCTPEPTGLVSWWKAEGNGVDSISGNTAYAALLPDGVNFAPGKVGQAFQLNDTNAFLMVPASPSLDVGAGSGVTMEGWIKVASVSGLHPIAEWHGDTREEAGVQLWIDSNPFQNGALFGALTDTNLGQHTLVSPEGIVQPNVFQHVALTYDKASGIATLYLNGAMVAQANLGSFVPATAYDLWIAHRPLDVPGDWTYGATLGGLLDELSIYNRALGSNEIAAIYHAGAGGKCDGITSGVGPTITGQPTNRTVAVGGNVTFTVSATGDALHYQWYGPGSSVISGANNSTLTLSNVQQSNAGSYFVLVTNSFGSAQSSNAVLTVTGGGGGGTNACTQAPSGIVAWWPGEGNGGDVINGNNAILENGVTFAPGKVGQSFQLLNYSNGWMHVPASPSLNVGAGAGLTVEGWINVASVDGFHPIAEWHGATRNDAGVQLWLNSNPGESGALFASVVDANHNTHNLLSADGVVQPNVFQHVALTYDKASGVATLYLNGEIVAQSNVGSIVPLTAGADLYFGYRPLDVPGDWTYGAILGGSLDEFAVYNRALGSGEIASIYNSGSNGKCGVTSSGTTPVITHQPTNQTVAAGANAIFTVAATGAAPLHYQWYGPSETLIPGANTSTLTLSNVQPANAGAYFAFVTNQFGFAQSSNAVLTVTGSSGGGTNSTCTPAPSGLVALWKGENNALDSAGSNNGSATGGSLSYAPGEVGSGFHYTDSNGYVSVPPSSSLNVGLGAGFTLEAWIQPADLQNEIPIFEWQYNTNSNVNGSHFWVSAIGGPGCLFANIMESNGNPHWIYSAPGIVTAGYQHVALTYDKSSGVASIYRNGVLVTNQNIGSFTPNTTGNLLLGERTFLNNEPQFHYLGDLDEMSVYSRALSQSEIAAIYNAGANGKCAPTNSSTGTAPVVTHQPTNETVNVGGTASFSVTATGSQPLHFQWFGPNSTLIPGATTSTLTLPNVQQSKAGMYFVFVTNSFGFAQSSNAVLTVMGSTQSNMAPVITRQPTNRTVAVGGNVTFTVLATGSPTLHYQWYGPSNTVIPGAQTPTLTLSNVQQANAGTYFVRVTNSFGFAQSSNAILTVTGGSSSNSCTPPPSGLVSWWKAEGNAKDSADGNNGTLVNGVGFAAGEVGQAFLFTHTNQDVLIPASSNLDVGLGDGLTLEAWIKPSNITNFDPILEYNPGDGVTYWGVHLYVLPTGSSNGQLYANVQGVGDNWHQMWSSPGLVIPNTFQHVALTYDKASGVARLYLNGAIVVETAFGTFTPKTTGNLNIGNRPTDPAGSQFTFTGLIDEPSVYNRALGSNEIAAIYHAGSNGKCDLTNSSTGTAPVITHQPTNQTVAAGGNATFTVTATGTAPIHYDWYGPNDTKIPGANSSTLTLSNVQPADAGSYYAFVTNLFGFAHSSNAVLTVTGGGGGTNSCTPAPSGIVGWWPGEGNGNDVVGNNNAILESGVTFAPGEVGQAFQLLNFTNGWAHVPASSNLNVGAGPGLTMEGWINVSSVDGLHPIVEWHGNSREETGVTLWLNSNPFESGSLYASVIDTNETLHSLASGDGTVQPNVFQHVALTYDKASGTATLYLNGTVVAQASVGSIVPQTTSDLYFGHRPLDVPGDASYGATLGGSLDEFTLYNRALGSNEIAAIYNAGSGGKCSGTNSNSGVAPAITQQPTNQTVAAGGNATFTVTATGTAPIHYDWYGPNDTKIPGANLPTLTLSNVQPANAGSYYAFVTNSFGFAHSSNAVLTVTGGGGNTNSCTPAPSGIVGWWPGEGNGNDIVNGNNAILESGVTFGPGKVGQAFQLLNYTNGWAHVPASSNLNVGAGAGLTMEGWINVSSVDGFHPIAEWHGTNRDQTGVILWLNSNPLESGALTASVVDTNHIQHDLLSADNIVKTNVFQHVALTYDKASGIARLYLNSTIVAESNVGSIVPLTTYDLYFGHRPLDVPGDWTYGAILGGSLDEFAVYNRALGSNEIAAIYNAGSNGKCPALPIVPHAIINPQPQPTVNMSVAGNTPMLSWPLSADGFILQSADNLTPPINWTNVPGPLQTNGGNIEITLPEGGQHGYFRLYHP
jgi:hypothetical protein